MDPRPAEGFVGRADELAVFASAVDAARHDVPSVLIVRGDAGIGKSTLVSEAAVREGVPLFLARCVPVGSHGLALAPLTDLVRHVERSAQRHLLEDERFAGAARAVTSTLGGGAREGELFLAVIDLLGALGAPDAVMVCFEDLQWADPSTWDFVDYLARNLIAERLVLVATYRDDDKGYGPVLRQRVAELARVPGARRIHLGGFTRDDVAARVTALLGTTPSIDLLDELVARGEGNPLFTEELVAAHLEGETLPSILADLLGADIAAAGPEARAVLDTLSVIGREAPHELLLGAVERPDEIVERGLRDALDAKLIVADRDTHRYRFRHPLIGEVVYDALTPSERRRQHARVATVLVAERPTDASGEVAFHLERAGDAPAAVVAALAAADAVAPAAPAVALVQLERALALWDDAGHPPTERSARLWQAAELASATGVNHRAVELAQTALGLGVPPRGMAWGYERLGRYRWADGQLDASAVAYADAAAALTPDVGSVDAAAVYAGLAQAELMQCRFDQAEDWCRRTLATRETASDRAPCVAAGHFLALVHSHRGEHDRAFELCRTALAEADGLSAQVGLLAVVYYVLALMAAGRHDDAVTAALDGMVEAQRAGLSASYAAYLAGAAAEGLVRLGRWSEADTVLRGVEGLEPIPIAASRLRAAGALLHARRGDRERADALAADALSAPVGAYHHALAGATVAEAYLALGRWADAATLVEALTAAAPVPITASRLAMLRAITIVETALDARDEPSPFAAPDDVRSIVDTRAGPVDVRVAESAYTTAVVSLLDAPAPDAWAEAAQAWERAGDPWWAAMARTHEVEAAARLGAAARASDSLREAHRAAVALGAGGLNERIAALARITRLRVDAPDVAELGEDVTGKLGLSPREAEVLGLVAAGMTNREIGEKLFVSEKTASVHVSNILRKLGVTSRVEAAAVAQRAGLS